MEKIFLVPVVPLDITYKVHNACLVLILEALARNVTQVVVHLATLDFIAIAEEVVLHALRTVWNVHKANVLSVFQGFLQQVEVLHAQGVQIHLVKHAQEEFAIDASKDLLS